MEIKDKSKIKINLRGVFEKIKKEFRDDYFKLTFLYLAVYSVISMVMVYGLTYLINGGFEFDNLRSELTVVTITFMMTIATMAKKLKDDLISNYWKLRKFKQRQIRGKK